MSAAGPKGKGQTLAPSGPVPCDQGRVLEVQTAWLAGELSLADALLKVMRLRAPVPPRMMWRIEMVFGGYETGIDEHLEDGFGIAAPLNRRRRGDAEDKRQLAYFGVEHFRQLGYRVGDPSLAKDDAGNAHCQVAKDMGLKPSSVFKYWKVEKQKISKGEK